MQVYSLSAKVGSEADILAAAHNIVVPKAEVAILIKRVWQHSITGTPKAKLIKHQSYSDSMKHSSTDGCHR